MTVKVKNIQIKKVGIDVKSKDYLNCIKYINMVGEDPKKYIPTRPKETMSFELTDTNVDLANTIRRYLHDEIKVCSMHVEESNIISNDEFILSDYLKKNIELIPFMQHIEEKEASNIKLSIDIHNTSDKIIQIYSRDILCNGKSSEKYITQTIPIITLRPTKRLIVNDITLCYGIGKDDMGKFSSFSNIKYKIMDAKPLNLTRYDRTGESSMVSKPSHFFISITTHRNASTKKIMKKCINGIISDIQQYQKDFANIKKNDITYFSDILELEVKGAIYIYHFKGQYWTMANLISKYCYLEDETIPFVCSSIIHPSCEESLLKIKHIDSLAVINNAFKKMLSEFEYINKQF